jgi:hyperosmotically inducible protein
MKKLFGLGALLVACVCVNMADPAQAAKETDSEKFAKSQEQAPDNTAKNKRDKDNNTMTADKAGNSKSDVEIAREIRKGIMADKGLSVNAQNVKVIVKHGALTLRGPVDNQAEKDSILNIAKTSCAGALTDKLEVKGQTAQKP